MFSKKNTKQDKLKQLAAIEAVQHIESEIILGVGTGSTVYFFIEALVHYKSKIKTIVSSSEDSTSKLKKLGFEVCDLNYVGEIDLYIDGADESNLNKELIKGGGASLTREKICVAVAKKFVCIIDESKKVNILGSFPLPIEVIPMAKSHVENEVIKLGGQPVYRDKTFTDNGNIILDVYNLEINSPVALETRLNQITGVVTNGIFALKPADIVIMAKSSGEIESF